MIRDILHLALEVEQCLGLPAAFLLGWSLRPRRARRDEPASCVTPIKVLEAIEEHGVPIPLAAYAAAANLDSSSF